MVNQGEMKEVYAQAREYAMPRTAPVMRPRAGDLVGPGHLMTQAEFDAVAKKLTSGVDPDEVDEILEDMRTRMRFDTDAISAELEMPPEPAGAFYYTIPIDDLRDHSFSLGMFKGSRGKDAARLALFLDCARTALFNIGEGGYTKDEFVHTDDCTYKRVKVYMEYLVRDGHGLPCEDGVYHGHIKFCNVLGLRFHMIVFDAALMAPANNPLVNFMVNRYAKTIPPRKREEVLKGKYPDLPDDVTFTPPENRFPAQKSAKKHEQFSVMTVLEALDALNASHKLYKLTDPDNVKQNMQAGMRADPGEFEDTYAFSNKGIDVSLLCAEQRARPEIEDSDFAFPFPDMTFELVGAMCDPLYLFTCTLPYSDPWVERPLVCGNTFLRFTDTLKKCDDLTLIERAKLLAETVNEIDPIKDAKRNVEEHMLRWRSSDDPVQVRKERQRCVGRLADIFSETSTTNNATDAIKVYARSEEFLYQHKIDQVCESLSSFGNYMAFLYKQTEVVLKDDCNHDLSITTCISVLNGLRFKFSMKINLMVQGAPSVGKTHAFQLAETYLFVPSTIDKMSDVSKKSYSSNTDVQQRVEVCDEAPDLLMSRDGKANPMIKTVLTEGRSISRTCGSSDNNRKEVETRNDKMFEMIIATNSPLKDFGSDLLDRFRVVRLPERKRLGYRKGDRGEVAASTLFQSMMRTTQSVMCVLELMIYCGVLKEVDESIAADMYRKFEEYYKRQGFYMAADQNREIQRFKITARTLAMMHAVHVYLNETEKAFFAENPFLFDTPTLEKLQGIEPHLRVTEDVSVFALSLYSNILCDPHILYVLELLMSQYDRNMLRRNTAEGTNQNTAPLLSIQGFYSTRNIQNPIQERVTLGSIAKTICSRQSPHNHYTVHAIEDILISMKSILYEMHPIIALGEDNGNGYLCVNEFAVNAFLKRVIDPSDSNREESERDMRWVLRRQPEEMFAEALQGCFAHKNTTLRRNTLTGFVFDNQCPYALHTAQVEPKDVIYKYETKTKRVRDEFNLWTVAAKLETPRVESETIGEYSLRVSEYEKKLTARDVSDVLKRHNQVPLLEGAVRSLGSYYKSLDEGVDAFTFEERKLATGWSEVPPLEDRYEPDVPGQYVNAYPLRDVLARVHEIQENCRDEVLKNPPTLQNFYGKISAAERAVNVRKRVRTLSEADDIERESKRTAEDEFDEDLVLISNTYEKN